MVRCPSLDHRAFSHTSTCPYTAAAWLLTASATGLGRALASSLTMMFDAARWSAVGASPRSFSRRHRTSPGCTRSRWVHAPLNHAPHIAPQPASRASVAAHSPPLSASSPLSGVCLRCLWGCAGGAVVSIQGSRPKRDSPHCCGQPSPRRHTHRTAHLSNSRVIALPSLCAVPLHPAPHHADHRVAHQLMVQWHRLLACVRVRPVRPRVSPPTADLGLRHVRSTLAHPRTSSPPTVLPLLSPTAAFQYTSHLHTHITPRRAPIPSGTVT
jgi:hypothetical protein